MPHRKTLGIRKKPDIPLTVVGTTVLTVAMLWPLEAPPQAPEGSDKLLHFIAFATLAFPLAHTGRFGVILVLIGASAFGAIIELMQPTFNRRAVECTAFTLPCLVCMFIASTSWISPPLFAGYMFVACDPEQATWRQINSTYGISRMLSPAEGPKPMPEALIAGLRARCDNVGKVVPKENFEADQSVEMHSGPFANFIATVEQMTSDTSVWVLLDFMGKETASGLTARKSKRFCLQQSNGLTGFC